ncbi:MAG: hypothetical protein HQL32_07260 [Planctomycetes bacterium]|nr:hypothetical protein [Planctomycetota bacterium]
MGKREVLSLASIIYKFLNRIIDRRSDEDKAVENIVERIKIGLPEEQFKTLRCPICDKLLKTVFNEEGDTFDVYCVDDPSHIAFVSHIINPPEYWKKYQGGSWM